MASRVRNEDWKEDADLIDDLAKYVSQNLYKREILNLVEVRYPQYAWSMRTLTRRLQHFDIKYIDYDIDVETVKQAVEKEMEGPGKLLGYRALHKKIREIHGRGHRTTKAIDHHEPRAQCLLRPTCELSASSSTERSCFTRDLF